MFYLYIFGHLAREINICLYNIKCILDEFFLCFIAYMDFIRTVLLFLEC